MPTTKQRLFRLLATGREMTLDQLEAELEVSRRHVRRLLKKMDEEGTTVRTRWDEGRKVISIAEEHRRLPRPELDLTEREVYALTVAAEASRAALAPTPLGEHLQDAFDKLIAATGESVMTFEPEVQHARWHFGQSSASNLDPAIFQAVRRAIDACRSLRITYTSSSGRHSTDRLIDPYLLAVRGTSWLLVAHCHRRGRVLDFALAAIDDAQPTDRYFSPDPEFDPDLHFRDRFTAMKGDEIHIVRLQVEPGKAPFFKRKSYHPTQQIEDEKEDGSLTVSYEVSGLDEIAAFIRSWGPGVVATAPTALTDRLRGEAEQVAASYESAGAPRPLATSG